ADDAALRGGIARLADLPVEGGDRRRVHDHATLAVVVRLVVLHDVGRFLDQDERAEQVHLERALERRCRQRTFPSQHAGGQEDARAVHRQRDAVHQVGGFAHRGLHRRLVGDVGTDEARSRPELGGALRALLLVQVEQGDPAAGGDDPLRRCEAQSRCAAGDDGFRVFELHDAPPTYGPGTSMATAVASPPPMHKEATPRPPPLARSACTSVTTILAPDAPIGWPSAHAPPLTFTFACSRPRSCIAAMVTQANASLISYRSTSLALHPVRSRSARMAPTGAVVNHAGSCAAPACPTMRASTGRPRRRASLSRMRMTEAAPSEIDEELAAVIVPFSRNAGLRPGIRPTSLRSGPSSRSTSTVSLRPFT